MLRSVWRTRALGARACLCLSPRSACRRLVSCACWSGRVQPVSTAVCLGVAVLEGGLGVFVLEACGRVGAGETILPDGFF